MPATRPRRTEPAWRAAREVRRDVQALVQERGPLPALPRRGDRKWRSPVSPGVPRQASDRRAASVQGAADRARGSVPVWTLWTVWGRVPQAPGQAPACSAPPKDQDRATQHSAPLRALSPVSRRLAAPCRSPLPSRSPVWQSVQAERHSSRQGRARPRSAAQPSTPPRRRGDTAGREQRGKNPGIHQPTPEARLVSKACTPDIGASGADIQPKTAICWNPGDGAIGRGQSLSSGQDRQQPDSRKLPKIHSPHRAPPLHYSNQAQGRRLGTGEHPREVAHAPLANRLCRRGGVGAPEG